MTVSLEKIHPYAFVGMKGFVHIPVSVLSKEQKFVLAHEIIDATCKFFAIKDGIELMKKSREEPLMTSRHIAAYLIKKMTNMKDGDIGILFNRDRTTIIHSVELISGYIKVNSPSEIIQDINSIKSLI